MELKNETTGTAIANVRPVSNTLGKMRGLMFKSEGRLLLQFGQEKRYALWMPFVQFPLDAAFINREKEVVHIERDMQPLTLEPRTWRTYASAQPCCHILEVEAGLLEEKGWQEGDVLSF